MMKKNVEDIDTTQEDHIYDECRYFLMRRIKLQDVRMSRSFLHWMIHWICTKRKEKKHIVLSEFRRIYGKY